MKLQPAGILSVLYAGSIPVVLHYGMIERDLLHYWFPAYDPTYAYGSPGTQLFLEVARAAASQGVVAIDMGYGEQAYKHKLASTITEMSCGMMDTSRLRCAMYASSLELREKLKHLKLREKLKPLVRKLMPGIGKNSYR